METLIPFALLCFTSFFTLTNPLGTMPVFLTMTQGMTDKERCSIVKRATLVSFITLMVFVFAGQFLFKFFGISTNGFRIAGGVIIFKIGFDMLQARYTPMKLKDEEIKTYADDISITPLGIPMLSSKFKSHSKSSDLLENSISISQLSISPLGNIAVPPPVIFPTLSLLSKISVKASSSSKRCFG